MFIWKTIDTKFPPIPVVPHCFQLQEFEGGEKESEGKFRKGGEGGCKEGRKTVPLAQGSDVHLSTLFSQLSPV